MFGQHASEEGVMDEEFSCCGCCSVLVHLLFCLTGRQPMRATSFGVQATDYQAPPASDPSGSGQSPAQQADGSRRGTERVTLLPKGSVSSSQPQREAGTPNSGRNKRGGDDRSGQSGAELTSFGKLSRGSSKANLKEGLEWGAVDEDACPTCLELYTDENPAITTRCNHQFHLACIYEWLERSQTCPICSQRLEFDELV